MASGLSPKFNPTSELKSKLLRPALTSHYAAYFNVAEILGKSGARNFFSNREAIVDGETLSLYCSEASLPGSSLATHEANNDFTGVTERHAYRRQYDDRIDFTFYVDHDYKVIKFFETWMSWIVGEDQFTEQSKLNYSYRVKFPEDYQVTMYIQKFEKDLTTFAEYTFVGAYPISITSIPVSYDSSQLLKCTVSFNYIRYYLDNLKINVNSLVETQQRREDEVRRNLPPGVTLPDGGVDLDAFIRNNTQNNTPTTTPTGPIPLQVQPFKP